MADINLTQVIHNVKEAYVDLTGDTDDITYGNISTKISEISLGGGGGKNTMPYQNISELLKSVTAVIQ